MKITRQQLEEIIKEELQSLLQEDPDNLEEDNWRRRFGGALGGAALAMGTLGAPPPVSAKAPTTTTTQVRTAYKMNVLNKAGGLINAAAARKSSDERIKAAEELRAALQSAEDAKKLSHEEARNIFFTARKGATGKLSGKDALEKIQSILYRS